MLRRTLIAATRMDYPHQTWLLDDGNRPEMKELAESAGMPLPRARTRTPTPRPAISTTRCSQPGRVRRRVRCRSRAGARLPAPHARLLPRRQVAFVQTPQDFYNLDSYQHRRSSRRRLVWTEQSLFFRVIQRGKDYWNAAFFCGSCAILRRRALDEVNGFATGTVTEDLQTSIRLHRKGFASVYHAESLAYGVAPATIGAVPAPARALGARRDASAARRRHPVRPRPDASRSASTISPRSRPISTAGRKACSTSRRSSCWSPASCRSPRCRGFFSLHFIPFYLLTFWVFEEVGRGYGRTCHDRAVQHGALRGFRLGDLRAVQAQARFSGHPEDRRPSPRTRAAGSFRKAQSCCSTSSLFRSGSSLRG